MATIAFLILFNILIIASLYRVLHFSNMNISNFRFFIILGFIGLSQNILTMLMLSVDMASLLREINNYNIFLVLIIFFLVSASEELARYYFITRVRAPSVSRALSVGASFFLFESSIAIAYSTLRFGDNLFDLADRSGWGRALSVSNEELITVMIGVSTIMIFRLPASIVHVFNSFLMFKFNSMRAAIFIATSLHFAFNAIIYLKVVPFVMNS